MRWRTLAILTLFVAGCRKGERASSGTADAAAAQAASRADVADSASSADDVPIVAPVATASARSDPPSPVSEWVWKTYRGDHFTVLFPGEPKLKALPAEEDRVGYTEASVDVPGGQVSFAAGFSDYPPADVAKPEGFLHEPA